LAEDLLRSGADRRATDEGSVRFVERTLVHIETSRARARRSGSRSPKTSDASRSISRPSAAEVAWFTSRSFRGRRPGRWHIRKS
jgi:hypothetical protein